MPSFTNSRKDCPLGKSKAVTALTIGRFRLIAVSWSKPTTFALLELWIDDISHPLPRTQVSAPPSRILI